MSELRELAELRTDVEELARDLADHRFRWVAGLPPRATLPQIAKAHRLATSHDGLAQAVEELGNAASGDASPARLARLGALRDFLVRARALGLEPGAAQEIVELELRPSVRPPGDPGLHGPQPVVQVDRELPFIASRDERAELEHALADGVAEQASARSSVWDATQAALEELELGDPGEAAAALQTRGWTGADGKVAEGKAALETAAAQAERLLRKTDPLAADLGGWLVERLTGARRFPGGAERHDVLHLVHAPGCASAFPRGEQLRTLRRWAEMLRLDLSEGGCIRVDEEERPLKRGGAHAIATEPPAEVRISLWPQLGPQALAELLSATGEALVLAGPPDEAPPEDRWLGDEAIRVASAALLAGLARDPLWIKRCAKADLRRDDERAVAYAAVVEARLAAAAAISSIEAHRSGGLTGKAVAAHRDLAARALSAEIPSGLAFRELDPWLSSWTRLRGLSLAARIRSFLRERHDEDWWRNPRSLPVLRALWSRGGRPTLPELWSELGADPPSVDWLADELAATCA